MCKQQVLIHQFGLALPIVAELQVCIQRLDIKFVHLQNFTPLNRCDCNAAEQKMESYNIHDCCFIQNVYTIDS